jgi:hypothetical protein
MREKSAAAIALTCFVALAPASALALPITFHGAGTNAESGQGLDATVTFDVSGTSLIVTLANTSTADVLRPTDVLTAVFFNVTGSNPTLTPTSAVLASGSTVLFAPAQPAGGVVGGEWAYAADLSGPEGTTRGGSSVGLGLFGPGDRFPGSNLQGPDSPDGLQYGLTSAGDDPTTGNAPVTGGNHLIQSSVVLTLAGLPSGFDPSTSISNVWFQYGTGLDEPRIPADSPVPEAPEPASFLLFGSGLAGLGWMQRRRRRDLRR